MTFQTFDATTSPEDGPPRLERLRAMMAEARVDAFLVPRADAHQGEHVADCDDRLAWLTGFTGSAGFAVVLAREAGVFVDGRYTVQVRTEVDTAHFTPVDWPKTRLTDWLPERLDGGRLAIDPWLHTGKDVDALKKAGIDPVFTENLVDAIWADRPAPPKGRVEVYPAKLAGKSHADKIAEIAGSLGMARSAVLTLPDSIAWLLNIRGSDLPRLPIVRAFAVLGADRTVALFTDALIGPEVENHLGEAVTVRPYDALPDHLKNLDGPVRVDPASAPVAVTTALAAAGIDVIGADDPCLLPKARKTPAELAGTTEAHLRDGAAMCEFLAWLDTEAETLSRDPAHRLTEIDVARKLEGFRRATNALKDISFESIVGAGEHGAIVHYRVNRDTNRTVKPGDLLLVDSGGQYLDGTTDITRTIPIGPPGSEEVAAFTRVLQGMIAVSRARWPKGLAGRDLDALARAPLWMAGQDFNHGTGHGVGVYLSVHEGPQRLSKTSEIPLEPGMILSNEPGYYREGAFGIRLENLVVVEEAERPVGGDDRDQLSFRTLTYVPLDLRLIDASALAPGERAWLNAYHTEVNRLISPRVSDSTKFWLEAVTRAI